MLLVNHPGNFAQVDVVFMFDLQKSVFEKCVLAEVFEMVVK